MEMESECVINKISEGSNDFNIIICENEKDISEINFKSLLNGWGVANDTANYFWNLKISIEVLKKFKLEDIDKVFPDLKNYGEKVHFRYGLEKWRKEIVSKKIILT